jgi:hypothetical protein
MYLFHKADYVGFDVSRLFNAQGFPTEVNPTKKVEWKQL